MKQVLLIVGNPVDGFIYIGPFETYEDATEFAEKNDHDYWWATDLHTS
jgi:hypothetical protein